jgi:hypothetical protein
VPQSARDCFCFARRSEKESKQSEKRAERNAYVRERANVHRYADRTNQGRWGMGNGVEERMPRTGSESIRNTIFPSVGFKRLSSGKSASGVRYIDDGRGARGTVPSPSACHDFRRVLPESFFREDIPYRKCINGILRNIFVISEFDQSHNFMFRRSHCSLFIFNNPFANANVGERTSKDHRYSHLPLQTDPGRCPSTFRTSCLLVVSCVCVCVCVSMQSGRASPTPHSLPLVSVAGVLIVQPL